MQFLVYNGATSDRLETADKIWWTNVPLHALALFFQLKKGIKLIPKTIGKFNRKRNCAWGCSRWNSKKYYLKKFPFRKAQISNVFVPLPPGQTDLCFAICRFFQVVLSNLTHNFLFYFQQFCRVLISSLSLFRTCTANIVFCTGRSTLSAVVDSPSTNNQAHKPSKISLCLDGPHSIIINFAMCPPLKI